MKMGILLAGTLTALGALTALSSLSRAWAVDAHATTGAFVFGVCREQPGAPWRAYERAGESGKVVVR